MNPRFRPKLVVVLPVIIGLGIVFKFLPETYAEPGIKAIAENEEGLPDGSGSSPHYYYEYRLSELNQATPIELQFNDDVIHYIDLYLGNRRSDLERMIARSEFYFPIIEEMLDRYELPLELKYIAVVESGLNPLARSKSGAVGLWQFLYGTAQMFDLEIDSYIDERRDPYLATEAACRYFQYLYRTYNDWNLVMASYNGGPGEVRKAIERTGGETDYWKLRPYISKQAANYVPAFIAFNYLFEHYKEHDIQPAVIYSSNFKKLDTLHIKNSLSFDQIASAIDISIKELQMLNPSYRRNYIPKRSEPEVLVLPSYLAVKFIRYENRIAGLPVNTDDYNDLVRKAGITEGRTRITHTVKRGEYYHLIALKYECTIENIKAWNSLDTKPLYPGQVLDIWVKNTN